MTGSDCRVERAEEGGSVRVWKPGVVPSLHVRISSFFSSPKALSNSLHFTDIRPRADDTADETLNLFPGRSKRSQQRRQSAQDCSTEGETDCATTRQHTTTAGAWLFMSTVAHAHCIRGRSHNDTIVLTISTFRTLPWRCRIGTFLVPAFVALFRFSHEPTQLLPLS